MLLFAAAMDMLQCKYKEMGDSAPYSLYRDYVAQRSHASFRAGGQIIILFHVFANTVLFLFSVVTASQSADVLNVI